MRPRHGARFCPRLTEVCTDNKEIASDYRMDNSLSSGRNTGRHVFEKANRRVSESEQTCEH